MTARCIERSRSALADDVSTSPPLLSKPLPQPAPRHLSSLPMLCGRGPRCWVSELPDLPEEIHTVARRIRYGKQCRVLVVSWQSNAGPFFQTYCYSEYRRWDAHRARVDMHRRRIHSEREAGKKVSRLASHNYFVYLLSIYGCLSCFDLSSSHLRR